MASFDRKNYMAIAPAVDMTTATDDGATVGNIIDTQGFEAVTFVLSVGAHTSGTYTVTLFEGDESDLGDAEAVDAELVLGSIALDDEGVAHMGYIGKKRYVRATVTTTEFDTTGATFVGVAVMEHATVNPPSYS